MTKKYFLSYKVCEQIHRVIYETFDNRPSLKERVNSHISSGKKLSVKDLCIFIEERRKQLAKECNKKILKRTNKYISKNTLERILLNLELNKNCTEKFIIDKENPRNFMSYEYWLDEQLALQEMREGY